MSVTKRMRILKTVDFADFAEKNAKRIRILKTVEFADFAEKNAKRMRLWKWESSNVVFGQVNWSHCNVFYFCYANPKRKEFTLFHSIFECFQNSFIHKTMLFAASGAEGFRDLGSLPFSVEPKRIRQKSLGSLPKTEWPKEWVFVKTIWSLRSLPFSVEWYQKNGILASTNSTVFRRCPKEYALTLQTKLQLIKK